MALQTARLAALPGGVRAGVAGATCGSRCHQRCQGSNARRRSDDAAGAGATTFVADECGSPRTDERTWRDPVPANRSRTENFRESLHQIHERGGSLELSFKPASGTQERDVVFRVRLLRLNDHELIVSLPGFAGQGLRVMAGANVLASYSVGQNRWSFPTQTLGVRAPVGNGEPGLALQMPTGVTRCPRRAHERASTNSFNLPDVIGRPLLDPLSAVPAEAANRANIEAYLANAANGVGLVSDETERELLLPYAGPEYNAKLLNISPGGVGLAISQAQAPVLERRAFSWLQLPLKPFLPIPVTVTVRRVHTHLDSDGTVYAGFGFDFSFHPEQQAFVVGLVRQYVASITGAGGLTDGDRAAA